VFEGELPGEVIRNDRTASPRRNARHDQPHRDTSVRRRRTKPISTVEPRESSSGGAGSLPPPPSSNRTGGFPASGLPELLCHNTCTVSQRPDGFGLSGWKPNRRRCSETDSPSGNR
jgi:hypothetical protein